MNIRLQLTFAVFAIVPLAFVACTAQQDEANADPKTLAAPAELADAETQYNLGVMHSNGGKGAHDNGNAAVCHRCHKHRDQNYLGNALDLSRY